MEGEGGRVVVGEVLLGVLDCEAQGLHVLGVSQLAVEVVSDLLQDVRHEALVEVLATQVVVTCRQVRN